MRLVGLPAVSLEAVVHEVLTVSFSTVSLDPLTAAAHHPSPGVPSHYGSRKPRVTNKGAKARLINPSPHHQR
jgi:hypothetical protein